MSNLVPPTFAGSSLHVRDAADMNEGLVTHDIGDDETEIMQHDMDNAFTKAYIHAQLEEAFEQAISEIDSAGSHARTPPEKHRFGDLSGIIAAQPLAAELRETIGSVTAAAA